MQLTKCSAIEAQAAVHIGAVGTGVIGTYRWQYKCCSSDMLVARDLACQGLPGYVCSMSTVLYNSIVINKCIYSDILCL